MCVIVYKPKNIELPSKDILKTCYKNNSDGAGYTFTSRHKVIIKKGYQDFDTFYNELLKDYKKYNLANHSLILHFRIGTSGGLTKEKTQPFKITSNIKELNKLYIKNKKASLVHNGVFSEYTYNKELSDTQNYIKDFLQPLLKSKIKNKKTLVNNSLDYSKLAILNNRDNVLLLGDFIKDKGVYYSNNSYNNYFNKINTSKYNFSDKGKRLITTYTGETLKTQYYNNYKYYDIYDF